MNGRKKSNLVYPKHYEKWLEKVLMSFSFIFNVGESIWKLGSFLKVIFVVKDW